MGNGKMDMRFGKMDLQDVGIRGMDCIELVQDTNRWRALVNAEMNIPVI
jgi:hypothetical protein